MRHVLVLFACLCPGSAAAQGWIEPLPRPQPVAQQVERVRTTVVVRLDGRVARVAVEEWFRNAGPGLAEGDYHFPLPGEAVFSDLSLFQGEDELKGELMDARTARGIYEAIVRAHRDPALVELAGHGLLRARVFPIAPGESRRVVLRYTQVLARAGDALQFRFVAGSAPGRAPAPVRACTPPVPCPPPPGPSLHPQADGRAPVSLTFIADEGDAVGDPFSPTHELQISRDRNRLVARPAGDIRGSFDLFLPLVADEVGITLATHRVDGEEGYFMLTLSPGRAAPTREPRDVAVAVDVSGSMAGEKMEQARQALHRLLGTLNAGDRFRLVAFSTRIEAYRPGWTSATRAAIEEASAWVDRLSASGGTHIAGGLDELFREPGGAGRLHLAVFITDGLPTVGETNPDRIAANAEATLGDARLFAFGVGYDLNTYLLERIAVAGRGTVDYVRPGEDVEAAVGALATRLSHPVLVDLRFGGAPVRLTQWQPARLPDLYAGQELVVFGRYEASRPTRGELSLTGRRGGREERFSATVEFPGHASANAYIPALWAARRLGELTRTMQIEGVTPERMAEARDLALRYGLLSDYTSYLVQEPATPVVLRGRALAPAAAATFADSLALRFEPGQLAVETASEAGAQRRVQTMSQLAALQRPQSEALPAPGADRAVAGRRFRASADGWVDTDHATTARVVALEPFGPAWVAVLARVPELREIASAFESVTVAGARVSVRLAPGGTTRLGESEVQALVADFRGW
jgi:Ca-activated chloride channel homolog